MLTRRLLLAGLAAGIAFNASALAQQKAARPLKITVYGGSGNIGRRIVSEALARGHRVTVVDREPKPGAVSKNPRLRFTHGDVLDSDSVFRHIASQDVVIAAVRGGQDGDDFYTRVAKSIVKAQRAQRGRKTRYMMVGGSGSLEAAPGVLVMASIPEQFRPEVQSLKEALDYLRTVKDVSWTFFSPAGTIAPGIRTGRFRLGGDQIVRDANGESRISIEDYAAAMLDEIEKPRHRNERFTIGY